MMRREPSSPTETRALLLDRVRTAEQYFRNGRSLLERGEHRKAGELLWGSSAQMVKAVALLAGGDIRGHRRLREFVRTIVAERDPELYPRFLEIQNLHDHFYDETLDREDVELLVSVVRGFNEEVGQLLAETIGPPPGPPDRYPPFSTRATPRPSPSREPNPARGSENVESAGAPGAW